MPDSLSPSVDAFRTHGRLSSQRLTTWRAHARNFRSGAVGVSAGGLWRSGRGAARRAGDGNGQARRLGSMHGERPALPRRTWPVLRRGVPDYVLLRIRAGDLLL